MFDLYCESEQGSSCSTPFVSAPSSPSRSNQIKAARLKNNSLYYYFSAPSSPPRHRREEEDQQQEQQRGFSFAECEFEFQSRIFAGSSSQQEQHHQSSSAAAAAAALKNHQEEEEDQMMEDAHEMSGFYFSAPTSPDRNKDLRLKKSAAAAATCSYWDEMPGTPKMIFGSGAGSAAAQGFFNADSDFEFSSSRMSDSDSTISAQMSSADELFFKGQLLPMKLSSQLTSSDSSGSSNTMTSSSTVTGSAPQSPRSGKKGGILLGASPNRVKSAVMGTICGAVMKPEEESSSGSSAAGARVRSLSPFHLLKKYQSLMMTMGRPSSTCSSSTKSSGAAASSQIPRPSRSSSRGRTLRELLHLSSVHKKSKASSTPSTDQILQASSASDLKSEEIPKAATSDSTAAATAEPSEDRSRVSKKLNAGSSSAESRKRYVERSLVGDYSKRFNTKQQQSKPASPAASAAPATGIPRRRFHSGSVLDLHYSYYNSKRMLHSGSIVPEADFPIEKRLNYHAVAEIPHRRQMNHVYPRGDCNRFANAAALASSLDQKAGNHSRRWESGVYYSDSSRSMNGISSTSSSRNLSPRRARQQQQQQQGVSSGSCSSAQAGVSLHELHYKNQRANAEELRRKTFLPYKQGLLGCLGCATMRIAGLSKSLQPMAASRG